MCMTLLRSIPAPCNLGSRGGGRLMLSAKRRLAGILVATFAIVWCVISVVLHDQLGRIPPATTGDNVPHMNALSGTFLVAPTAPHTTEVNCAAKKSYNDIVECVPPDRRLSLAPSCRTVETWDDVQKCVCGVHPFLNRKPGVKKTISLIGERNSGTKFVVEEMKRCFDSKKYNVTISRDLWQRSKHFFQQIFWNPRSQGNQIVVAVFREPVAWVAAMIEKPYHMTEHQQGFDKDNKPIPLPWEEFVQRPWTMKNRSKYDFKLMEEAKQHPRKFLPCRTGMAFHEVIPCRFDRGTIPDAVVREQNPVYELKRGGNQSIDKAYQTILELRADKIVNFLLEVPLLTAIGGYMAVRYEDLVTNGTRPFLEDLAKVLGLDALPADCQFQGPRPGQLARRKVPIGLRTWVEDHLDLRTERLLGYR